MTTTASAGNRHDGKSTADLVNQAAAQISTLVRDELAWPGHCGWPFSSSWW